MLVNIIYQLGKVIKMATVNIKSETRLAENLRDAWI